MRDIVQRIQQALLEVDEQTELRLKRPDFGRAPDESAYLPSAWPRFWDSVRLLGPATIPIDRKTFPAACLGSFVLARSALRGVMIGKSADAGKYP